MPRILRRIVNSIYFASYFNRIYVRCVLCVKLEIAWILVSIFITEETEASHLEAIKKASKILLETYLNILQVDIVWKTGVISRRGNSSEMLWKFEEIGKLLTILRPKALKIFQVFNYRKVFQIPIEVITVDFRWPFFIMQKSLHKLSYRSA